MRKDLKTKIGEVLRAKREKLGISQEGLAELAGVDRTYVSILERGLKEGVPKVFVSDLRE
jgi:transcriptional regulator with XRE-family HTH domain